MLHDQAKYTFQGSGVTICLGAISDFLIGVKLTPSERMHTHYHKPGQKLVTWEIIDLKGETTAAVLFRECDVSIKLPSKHLCLQP